MPFLFLRACLCALGYCSLSLLANYPQLITARFLLPLLLFLREDEISFACCSSSSSFPFYPRAVFFPFRRVQKRGKSYSLRLLRRSTSFLSPLFLSGPLPLFFLLLSAPRGPFLHFKAHIFTTFYSARSKERRKGGKKTIRIDRSPSKGKNGLPIFGRLLYRPPNRTHTKNEERG